MLSQVVVDHIREAIRAELPLRGSGVAARLVSLDSEFARRGAIHSGGRIVARGQFGCDELSVRASLIWSIIQRCHRTFGGPSEPDLRGGLRQQIDEHLTAQAVAVRALVNLPAPEQAAQIIEQTIVRCRNELIAKYHKEVDFYVADIQRVQPPPSSGGSTVNIHGNVGAVQTGPNATAQIHLDLSASDKLVAALQQLQNALRNAPDADTEQREQGSDTIAALMSAARAPKPNGPMAAGLLKGVATTVQTIASLRPAWDFVCDAARLMGLPLP